MLRTRQTGVPPTCWEEDWLWMFWAHSGLLTTIWNKYTQWAPTLGQCIRNWAPKDEQEGPSLYPQGTGSSKTLHMPVLQSGFWWLFVGQNSLLMSDLDWVFKSWALALSHMILQCQGVCKYKLLLFASVNSWEDERTLGKNSWKLVAPVNVILIASAECLELIQHFSLNRNLVWNSWRHWNSLCYYKRICHSDNIRLYPSLGVRL